jgi:site-specific DNA-methyltransferase (adenine-specific)
MKLIQGDCLQEMQSIPDGSVDLILTDPPYGTTACKWDSVIPFDPMWKQLNRIIKANGVIALFGGNPFQASLIMSSPKEFRYEWIWEKNRAGNFASMKYQPAREHESISIFYKKTPNYYPIKEERKGSGSSRIKYKFNPNVKRKDNHLNIKHAGTNTEASVLRFPSSIQKFNIVYGMIHPTQKPVALMEYLIKTYTNEHETVLDFTMGSGTTGVACKNINREFIGIELDKEYFNIAKDRIENHIVQTELFI